MSDPTKEADEGIKVGDQVQYSRVVGKSMYGNVETKATRDGRVISVGEQGVWVQEYRDGPPVWIDNASITGVIK